MKSRLSAFFKIIKDNRLRLVCGLILCAITPLICEHFLENILYDSYNRLWNASRWNLVIILLFEIIVFFATLSLTKAAVITSILMTAFYIADFYVYSFRGKMLSVNDISAIGTAAKVMGNYSYALPKSAELAIALMCLVILVGTGLRTRIKKSLSVRLCGLLVAAVLAIGGFKVFAGSDFLLKQGFVISNGFIPSFKYDGYMVASCLHFMEGEVTAPEGYSKEKCDEILSGFKSTESKEELPNIIFVMNESFSDIRVNGNIELSKDILKDFYSYKDNAISGFINTSVWGGGTANTELEAFTGMTMAFLNSDYYPYQQCIESERESMISCLKDAGYRTVSIHPELSANWNRKNVYKYFGFDENYWMEDFDKDSEYIGNGISDRATYEYVKKLMEDKAPGDKLFVFDLTMQNHGGYTHLDVDRTVSIKNADNADAEIYLALMEESERAFKELADYVLSLEEKTLLVFFGDHQPMFGNEFYESIYADTKDFDPIEGNFNIYKTPFVILANYEIEEQDNMDISPNYLGLLTMKTAGVGLNPFFGWLDTMYERYPSVSICGYKDAEGNINLWGNEGNIFNDYRYLQYKYLHDTK